MKMKSNIFLVLFFCATPVICTGQVSHTPVNELARLFDRSRCAGNFQSGKMSCEFVLSHAVDAKKNKSGDHIILRTSLTKSSVQGSSATLDAQIVDVQSGANGGSVLRIRIDKAVREDGREIPVEARIVALVSQSSVREGWHFSPIIVDRFPRIPEDDERLPGEMKVSENQPHTSPLDSMPDIPTYYRVVCTDKRKKASGNPCSNLLEARGVYGYKRVTLEPLDPALATESMLTSKKNILFRAGTVLVLEVKNISEPF
jgi:hypothetical protein